LLIASDADEAACADGLPGPNIEIMIERFDSTSLRSATQA
jgi:hypothetical protein